MQNRNTNMSTYTGIRPLTNVETKEVSGGFPTTFVFGGVIAVGDLQGHVMNGVAKAALEVLLGK